MRKIVGKDSTDVSAKILARFLGVLRRLEIMHHSIKLTKSDMPAIVSRWKMGVFGAKKEDVYGYRGNMDGLHHSRGFSTPTDPGQATKPTP